MSGSIRRSRIKLLIQILSSCRADVGGKVAKTDETSSQSQFNNVYDGTTDYSANANYPANSAYQYNTTQWSGYGTAGQQQQAVCYSMVLF